MEKLRIYLNSLSVDEQKDFAMLCGTSIGYLRKAISSGQELSTSTCVKIEKLSTGNVTRIDLHPNDYLDHWPELAEAA